MKRRIAVVVGTRPNFMKAIPVVRALRDGGAHEVSLIHTGQHYDHQMSQVFLDQLEVGDPDHFLAVGSGTQAEQTGKVMTALETLLGELRPDLLLVPGDVNSTLAATLVASKLGIPIGHVEAGLRSFDRTMPEEVNRIVTDSLSDMLFTHSPEALDHLRAEGRSDADVFEVGNTMIDTLVAMREKIAALDLAGQLGVGAGEYVVVTLHRPALVDTPRLAEAIGALARLAADTPVVFPIHPRTRKEMAGRGIDPGPVTLVDPLGYLEFLSLVSSSRGVLTDSGGIQEETTYLGVPCLTLRDNTERPVTCSQGTNLLLGLRPERIADAPELFAEIGARPTQVPDGWDGHAAERIAEILTERDDYRGFADAAARAPRDAFAAPA